MASLKEQRYQERLLQRQRGAGSRRVESTGFTITAPTVIRPPPPLLPLSGEVAPPTTTAESTSTSITSTAVVATVNNTAKTPTRTSPRLQLPTSNGVPPSSSNFTNGPTASHPPQTSLPTNGLTPRTRRSTSSRISPVGASTAPKPRSALKTAATPETRGKRTRQPSPGRFLNTPERREVSKGLEKRRRDEESSFEGGGKGKESAVVVGSGGKRRKVVIEEDSDEAGEDTQEVQEEEIQISRATEMRQEKGHDSGRKSQGKRLPTPVATEEEEREAEEMEQERLRRFEPPESEPEEQGDGGQEVEDFSDIEEPEDSDGDGEHIPSDDDEDDEEPPEHALDDQRLFKPRPKPISSKSKSKSKSKSSAATPKRKRKPPSESKADDATATRSRPAGSIELTTYRLEKITGQDNPPVRSGFNPYDIVRQLFCELAAGFAKKVEGRVERAAVEGFERELDGRFIEMIDLFETQLAATVRARKENQRKLALQRELMEIRRQRQLVIAQTDDVRTNHKMAVVENKNRQAILDAASDITAVVTRGLARKPSSTTDPEDDEDMKLSGVDALAMQMADLVTTSGSGGGLLETVKDFNQFLERAEEALRRRNG